MEIKRLVLLKRLGSMNEECDKSHELMSGASLETHSPLIDTNGSGSDGEDDNIDIIDDDDEEEDEPSEEECEEDILARSRNHTPSTTPLDADGIGKSFTIAAILGLKKKQQQQDGHNLNDVMNLSLNHAESRQSAFQPRITVRDAESISDGSPLESVNVHHHPASQQPTSNSSLAALQTLHHMHVAAAGSGFAASPHQFHQHHPTGGGGGGGGVNAAGGVPMHGHHPHHNRLNDHAHPHSPQQQQQQQQSHLPNHHHHQFNHHHHHHHHHLAMAAHHHAQNHNREKYKDLGKKASLSASSALKSKRVRTIFTPEQLERLEAEFERQQYMVGPERLYLAHTLQLTEAQVKVWFQNRRIKWRKHHLEITQQRLALIRQRQIANGVVPPQAAGPHNNINGGDQASPSSSGGMPQQQQMMTGGRMMVGGSPESPELTICTDSLETRSVSESDD
ncbi:hypothetical protein pipiens_005353 [Culex pipiens pipiens]|uniref:Homeobox domain-containing protein n=1 Tax=Culex pipiens pipiens TaxID=38569 RepID=A0ABD1DYA3_CULPP